MPAQIYRFPVGAFECMVIQDGSSVVTAALIVGVDENERDRIIREAGYQPDALDFSINILLVNTGTQRILVDTGLGVSAGHLPETLKSQGIQPNMIDAVILTHGHGDHIGGIVDETKELIYPNARYFMWKSEWEYWLAEAQRPENAESAARVNLPAIQDRVTLIEHESEILPGVCALPAPGHTTGHMALEFASGNERLLHIADTAHHPIQVTHTGWSPRFDKTPDQSVATRRQLMERAARENLPVLAYHFAFPGLGRVVRSGDALVWQSGL